MVAELGPAARRRSGNGGRAEGPAGRGSGDHRQRVAGAEPARRRPDRRYTLLIRPLTLGSGTRLFEGPAPLTEFELTSSVTTTKGVIIAQYTRRKAAPSGPVRALMLCARRARPSASRAEAANRESPRPGKQAGPRQPCPASSRSP